MSKVSGKLTVYFEKPFWVGVFERIEDGKLSAAKVTFGAEPKDYEIYAFLLKYYENLRFSPTVTASTMERRKNPKRLQREAKKQIQYVGIGTKSQQALKLQQEENKRERKVKRREQRQAEAERMFQLRQQKKREKHRGR